MNLTANSTILVQGIMTPAGSTYTPLMQAYGTQIVAGVAPGYGNRLQNTIPVFDLVEQALTTVGPVDATVLFVPPYEVLDAALEAIAAGIHQIIIPSAGVPPLDMVKLLRHAESTETLVIGSGSGGVIIPGEILLGLYPPQFYSPGSVGVISRSSTLTHEVALELTQAGLGQSIAVSIGSDRVVGSSFQQWLQILEEDDRTEAIVLVGEIGGDAEEVAAHYSMEAIDKPMVAYLAGRTLAKGHCMGHAGAIIASQFADFGVDMGTAEPKLAAFKQAQIPVADRPSQIPALLKHHLEHHLAIAED